MAYQKPKKNHPWRQWQGKKPNPKKQEDKSMKPVYLFLKEIVQSWDTVEISTYAWGRNNKYKLGELPSRTIAVWLANLLRRNYG